MPTNVRKIWRDKLGRFKGCSVRAFDYDDPYAIACGSGEIANMLRRKDIENGCPWCIEDLIENASEPDVLLRWRY